MSPIIIIISLDDPKNILAHIMPIFVNTERVQVIDAKWFAQGHE